ncbi:hypothetical protein CWI37_0438p0020 [Hamiltosporidium tvaerminnensis]|uniref:Uncharacterized protein n=1 Tax=Hamiltosporidium tvaerminnensis TaxID=1176355 RepID=A0A4Q9L7J8_9MICR|nr:hypothetical protein CWI37_0438p0020 [Hamiltosporidium tvaerminnensis]
MKQLFILFSIFLRLYCSQNHPLYKENDISLIKESEDSEKSNTSEAVTERLLMIALPIKFLDWIRILPFKPSSNSNVDTRSNQKGIISGQRDSLSANPLTNSDSLQHGSDVIYGIGVSIAITRYSSAGWQSESEYSNTRN